MGAKGPGGRWEGWAHGAPWGYSEAIPNGWLFRMESYSMCSLSRENAEPNVCGSVWLDLDRFEWIWVDLSSFNEILSDFVDFGQRILLDLSGSVWI